MDRDDVTTSHKDTYNWLEHANSIPKSMPKIQQKLQVDATDFLYIYSMFQQRRWEYLPSVFMTKLFPRLDLRISKRIWKNLSWATRFLMKGFLLVFHSFQNTYMAEESYDLFYRNIDILQRYDFEDKHIMLGRMFLMKAMTQRLKIRKARQKMCEIAKLTRIQRYKIRQSLTRTLNEIKWWLTPEAEEIFKETLWTAAMYLDPIIFTVDHVFLALFDVLDLWWITLFIQRLVLF